jgi:hypothetical protein
VYTMPQVIAEQVLRPFELQGSALLFVDDDRKNVEEVRTHCPGRFDDTFVLLKRLVCFNQCCRLLYV